MSAKERPYSLHPMLRDLHEKKKHIVLVLALVLLILTVLTIYSYDTFGREGGCKLADLPPSNPVQKYLYDPLMQLRFPKKKARNVAMVTIKEGREPLSLITNTCESRDLLSKLVPRLVLLGADVIAIDQSFSDGACLDADTNDRFRRALEMAGKPVVAGLGTHQRPQVEDGDDTCLSLNKPFDFNHTSDQKVVVAKDNVLLGLIRLNNNDLKIPLRWWVLPDTGSAAVGEDRAEPHESFALLAAKLKRPSLAWDDKTLALDEVNDEHPFTSFVSDMPKWSATDIVCNEPLDKPDEPDMFGTSITDLFDCKKKVDHSSFDDLQGRVVVIGSEIASDAKPFLGEQKFGAELHANYIEALLRSNYVKTVGSWIDRGFVVFFVVTMLIFQFLAVRELPHYIWLSELVAVAMSTAVFVLLIVTALILLLMSNYFLPIFFASCFPIGISLLTLWLYQVHAIVTTKYKAAKKGDTNEKRCFIVRSGRCCTFERTGALSK